MPLESRYFIGAPRGGGDRGGRGGFVPRGRGGPPRGAPRGRGGMGGGPPGGGMGGGIPTKRPMGPPNGGPIKRSRFDGPGGGDYQSNGYSAQYVSIIFLFVCKCLFVHSRSTY